MPYGLGGVASNSAAIVSQSRTLRSTTGFKSRRKVCSVELTGKLEFVRMRR